MRRKILLHGQRSPLVNDDQTTFHETMKGSQETVLPRFESVETWRKIEGSSVTAQASEPSPETPIDTDCTRLGDLVSSPASFETVLRAHEEGKTTRTCYVELNLFCCCCRVHEPQVPTPKHPASVCPNGDHFSFALPVEAEFSAMKNVL